MSRLLWAVKAFLIAILLYVAVEAVVSPVGSDVGLRPKAVSGDERATSTPPMEPEPQARPDYSVIAHNDLFAGPNQGGPSGSLSLGPAPPVALPSADELGLKLLGIVAGGRTTSRAIIENAETRVVSPYKIGDLVASATVESIEPDRVVLVHSGRRVALRMHVATSGPARNETGNPTASAAPGPEPAAASPPSRPPSARLGYVEELFRKATIEPHVKDGRTEGLKITGLEDTPLANLFGLRNGDIVQTVNGQDLSSKQKAFQVLKKARTQSNINLQLLRDGKAKELSFDL
jgi:type II secretion system protein C